MGCFLDAFTDAFTDAWRHVMYGFMDADMDTDADTYKRRHSFSQHAALRSYGTFDITISPTDCIFCAQRSKLAHALCD